MTGHIVQSGRVQFRRCGDDAAPSPSKQNTDMKRRIADGAQGD